MPKTNIDYSNTIIYKITCVDSAITDTYVGHTTNFVQRKHAHKQSCTNTRSANYKCKLYETIRNNGGWDNWKMEIINFFNCETHYDARKKEQEYFVLLNANLNSLEPFPPKKPSHIKESKPMKIKYHCDICNVDFNSLDKINIHDQSKKHMKRMNDTSETNIMTNRFICTKCNFVCYKKSNFLKHELTAKHIYDDSNQDHSNKLKCSGCNIIFNSRTTLWRHSTQCSQSSQNNSTTVLENSFIPSTAAPSSFDLSAHLHKCNICTYSCDKKSDIDKHKLTAKHIKNVQMITSQCIDDKKYMCECGKQYTYRQGLFAHKKICSPIVNSNTTEIDQSPDAAARHNELLTAMILEIVNENSEIKQLLIEQNKMILHLAANVVNTK